MLKPQTAHYLHVKYNHDNGEMYNAQTDNNDDVTMVTKGYITQRLAEPVSHIFKNALICGSGSRGANLKKVCYIIGALYNWSVKGPTKNLYILNAEVVLMTVPGGVFPNQWEYYGLP